MTQYIPQSKTWQGTITESPLNLTTEVRSAVFVFIINTDTQGRITTVEANPYGFFKPGDKLSYSDVTMQLSVNDKPLGLVRKLVLEVTPEGRRYTIHKLNLDRSVVQE